MKILFLSHSFYPSIGGIESISEILADAFTKAGNEVRLMTWSQGGTEKKFSFKVIRNPKKKEIFQEHRWSDVVFEHNPSLQLSWPSLFMRRPLIVVLQTWISRVDGRMAFQDKIKINFWLKWADKVVAVSDAIRKRSFPKADVIGNPYNSSVFKMLPEIKRDKAFIFLGRLVSDKGASIAIEAIHRIREMNEIVDSREKISLTIVGDGPEKNNLEQLVEALRLNDSVTFTGAMQGEKLVKILNEHKFLLVPSVWEEPFGIVALEGMACGCIPIVSNGGGLPDAVGKAGLTFTRGDFSSLVSVIQNIMNNPSLERQLKGFAAKHLEAHRSDEIAKKYLNIIAQVTKK